MDKFDISPDDRSEFTREDVERLHRTNVFLRVQVAKASQIFEELYSFFKSIYEPSNDN